MIKTRIYYDNRRPDKNGEAPLRLVLSNHGKTAMISLGIKLMPGQWSDGMIVNHKDEKILNSALKMKLGTIERILLEKTTLGELAGKNAKEIAAVLLDELDPDKVAARTETARKRELTINGLASRFKRFISFKSKAGTKQLYTDTLNKIEAFCTESGKDLSSLSLNDVDVAWLTAFEKFCLRTQKQNTASRHLRDIRAVFNDAIDDGITSYYPFRKFKIHHEETKDKSFTSEEIRNFINYKSPIKGEQETIDIFMLMFCLIGINRLDLADCAPAERGRITYIRHKTGKLYDIKVEPEALIIINRYKGKSHLLDILERVPNPDTYYRRMDKNLKKIGKAPVPGKASIGEALLPGVSTGSARTSWATIAQEELDIPRDIIAAALGHHTVDVTTTYLRTDWRKKVDEANRKVLDWVLYKKK